MEHKSVTNETNAFLFTAMREEVLAIHNQKKVTEDTLVQIKDSYERELLLRKKAMITFLIISFLGGIAVGAVVCKIFTK